MWYAVCLVSTPGNTAHLEVGDISVGLRETIPAFLDAVKTPGWGESRASVTRTPIKLGASDRREFWILRLAKETEYGITIP